jgi:hypothetical protein
MRSKIFTGFILYLAIAPSALANSESLTAEPGLKTYNFVAHYRVNIDAPPTRVWPILIDLKSWMFDFELSTLSGESGTEGRVLQLYAGQEFKVQATKVIPNEMLAIVNLPMTFKDEFAAGIGVMTLHPTTNGTEVSLTMSRRYIYVDWRRRKSITPNKRLEGVSRSNTNHVARSVSGPPKKPGGGDLQRIG